MQIYWNKESFYIRKEFNSYTIGLEHKHGRRFNVLGHQYGRHLIPSTKLTSSSHKTFHLSYMKFLN